MRKFTLIGVYDYTVILTYLSAVFAILGTIISLSGNGHPCAGCIFLLFCGLFDAFDGKVARSKKGRTEYEVKFGIQIDSICDIIAFGVLPAAIGGAILSLDQEMGRISVKTYFFCAVIILYLVLAIARLAHFNVTEEERQHTKEGKRRFFQGVPVTTAALIFPAVLSIQYITGYDMTIAYFVLMLLMAVGFVVNVKVPKATGRGIIIMIIICGMEFIILMREIIK